MSKLGAGCDKCRGYWQKDAINRPEFIAVNVELQVRLVKCWKCGVLWEESQRFAKVIALSEAKLMFPKYFVGRVV